MSDTTEALVNFILAIAIIFIICWLFTRPIIWWYDSYTAKKQALKQVDDAQSTQSNTKPK